MINQIKPGEPGFWEAMKKTKPAAPAKKPQ